MYNLLYSNLAKQASVTGQWKAFPVRSINHKAKIEDPAVAEARATDVIA